ncbi:hypothetical protein [Asanoa ferruginea]|uniref:hypothetical protein n=1 Tax=Asanoa ferruginea TaxID=53367 RepID=UPI0011C11B0E|nr:hypothetical protein [Asanoa ferruginea]
MGRTLSATLAVATAYGMLLLHIKALGGTEATFGLLTAVAAVPAAGLLGTLLSFPDRIRPPVLLATASLAYAAAAALQRRPRCRGGRVAGDARQPRRRAGGADGRARIDLVGRLPGRADGRQRAHLRRRARRPDRLPDRHHPIRMRDRDRARCHRRWTADVRAGQPVAPKVTTLYPARS